MFKKISGDIVIACILIVFCIFLLIISQGIGEGAVHPMASEAATFPQAWLIIMLILATLLVIKHFFIKEDVSKDDVNKNDSETDSNIKSLMEQQSKKDSETFLSEVNVFFMIGAGIFFVAAINLLGYLITSFIYMILASYFLGREYINTFKDLVSLLLIAGFVSYGTYYIFATVLNVFLPSGIF